MEETQPDHDNRSSVAISKLLLGLTSWREGGGRGGGVQGVQGLEEVEEVEKQEQQQKGEMRFFEYIFSLDCLTFWLSYSTFSIITGSGTQPVNFMEKFCAKQVFRVDSFCISPMGTG